MYMYTTYWFFYTIMLFIMSGMLYYWDKIKESETTTKYIAFMLVGIYLFCGPFYCIFQTSYDIKLAHEYKAYKQQEIIPIQEQYNNATLPTGYYYLGCEIVDMKEEIVNDSYLYTYSFGVVDCEGRDDIYVYTSNQFLNPNVPYLLVMDSLATPDYEDDVIDVVWSCIE